MYSIIPPQPSPLLVPWKPLLFIVFWFCFSTMSYSGYHKGCNLFRLTFSPYQYAFTFIYVFSWLDSQFLLIMNNIPLYCCTSLSIHLLKDSLGWFQFWTIMNKTAINFQVQVFGFVSVCVCVYICLFAFCLCVCV